MKSYKIYTKENHCFEIDADIAEISSFGIVKFARGGKVIATFPVCNLIAIITVKDDEEPTP